MLKSLCENVRIVGTAYSLFRGSRLCCLPNHSTKGVGVPGVPEKQKSRKRRREVGEVMPQTRTKPESQPERNSRPAARNFASGKFSPGRRRRWVSPGFFTTLTLTVFLSFSLSYSQSCAAGKTLCREYSKKNPQQLFKPAKNFPNCYTKLRRLV